MAPLNETRLRRYDLSAIDFRNLTPEEWQAVKREVIRRAHAGRSEAIRMLFRWIGSRWTTARSGRDRRPPLRLSAGSPLNFGGRA